MIDAAHVPGMLDADVDTVGADFWVGNFHKWGLAPRATALLCVAPRWRDHIMPLVASYLDPEGYPRSIEHQGTRDVTPWLAAPSALDLLDALGPERVRDYNVAIAAEAQAAVGSALGISSLPFSGAGVSMRVIPLPVRLPDEPAAAALRARIATELRVETNVNPFDGGALLRVSGQIYVSSADVERLASGLPRLLST
jgi:isopenicillin-N epimerase